MSRAQPDRRKTLEALIDAAASEEAKKLFVDATLHDGDAPPITPPSALVFAPPTPAASCREGSPQERLTLLIREGRLCMGSLVECALPFAEYTIVVRCADDAW